MFTLNDILSTARGVSQTRPGLEGVTVKQELVSTLQWWCSSVCIYWERLMVTMDRWTKNKKGYKATVWIFKDLWLISSVRDKQAELVLGLGPGLGSFPWSAVQCGGSAGPEKPDGFVLFPWWACPATGEVTDKYSKKRRKGGDVFVGERWIMKMVFYG